MNDHELKQIRTALMGSPTAFELVILLYSRKLFAIAFAILQDAGRAEEAVQDVFLRAYRERAKMRAAEEFPIWLVAATRNHARDLLRKRQGATGKRKVGADEGASVEDLRLQPVRQALLDLPEEEREAITLRYLEGMDHEFVEKRLSLAVGGVRTFLARALAGLSTNSGRKAKPEEKRK